MLTVQPIGSTKLIASLLTPSASQQRLVVLSVAALDDVPNAVTHARGSPAKYLSGELPMAAK